VFVIRCLVNGARGRAVVRHDWSTWKRILQVKTRKRLVFVQRPSASVIQAVYRQGTKAAEDWTAIVSYVP
jgi:hypothetical protein